jgi:hypothetical protein
MEVELSMVTDRRNVDLHLHSKRLVRTVYGRVRLLGSLVARLVMPGLVRGFGLLQLECRAFAPIALAVVDMDYTIR